MENKNFMNNERIGNQIISFRDPDDESSKNFGPKANINSSVRNSSDPNEMNESG